MNVLIADCETDGLLDTYTRLWTLQLGSADGDDVTVYADQPGYPPLSEGLSRLRTADRVVFHNGLRFDEPAITQLYPGSLRLEQIYDTLVALRLWDPEERMNALRDWGERLKVAKGDYTGDFQSFTPELVRYGRQDIVTTRALYHYIEPRVRAWGESLELEFRTAHVIGLQERNGFQLNTQKAVSLEGELRQEAVEIERELQIIFPPIYVPDIRKGTCLVEPKVSNRRTGYEAGCPFSRVKVEEFNPGSEMQIERRFKQKYGWKPKTYTQTGRAKVDETVLAALPYAEAKPLLRYLRVTKQLGQLSDGDNAWLKLVKNGRVYGAVNTIGCAPGRMSHFRPNMAQVDKKDPRMREVWEPRPCFVLVGCDAEGLQARILAHYLARYDRGAMAERLVSGRKEDGTDVHSVNQSVLLVLGPISRDGAKRILYALMFGGGDGKLGWIFKDDCRNNGKEPPKLADKALGKLIRKEIAKGLVGINKLVEDIKAKVQQTRRGGKRGYLRGLDGRRIWIRSDHSALNFLLQGGEAVVMKKALCIFHFEQLPVTGWVHGGDFGYCVNVHDEVQIEARPEIAELVGHTFASCIKEAGVRLNVRCELAGAYSIGQNWKDTH